MTYQGLYIQTKWTEFNTKLGTHSACLCRNTSVKDGDHWVVPKRNFPNSLAIRLHQN